ncbi:MAG: response regulator [Ignavibacteria bacterium]|nr:response regulator [Ignavibacteria bacterium]
MKKVILTVDDSASVRQMIRFTLEDAGYSVIEATDGRDAITKLESNIVNLVFTDLNMPFVDGIQLIKHIRSSTANKFLPIIMITTESQNDKKMQGKQAGATGWIVKPFRPEQLVEVTKKILGS